MTMTRYLHKIVECDGCGKRYDATADTDDVGLLQVIRIGWYGSIYDMTLNIRTKSGSASQFSIKGDFCTKGCMLKHIRKEMKVREKM